MNDKNTEEVANTLPTGSLPTYNSYSNSNA